MVFMDERRTSWLFGVPRKSISKEMKLYSLQADNKDCERGFDIADAMEQGQARELVADFMHPLQHANKLWKFSVERSQDRRQYRLYCDAGEFLMFAKVSKDVQHVDFYLYDPDKKETLCDGETPAFSMGYDASRSEWRQMQERCDCCRYSKKHLGCGCGGRKAILTVQHTMEKIGDGTSHCMDVCVAAHGSQSEKRFVTKLPAWNEEVEGLVLEFKGRRAIASAKNFQVALEESPDQVVCQHAKIGPDTFSLDFLYPLTVSQAFGLSLATLFWA